MQVRTDVTVVDGALVFGNDAGRTDLIIPAGRWAECTRRPATDLPAYANPDPVPVRGHQLGEPEPAPIAAPHWFRWGQRRAQRPVNASPGR